MQVISFLKAVAALFLSFILMLSSAGFPRVPHEKDLELVWSDEFDGDTLDRTKWKAHHGSDDAQNPAVRRGSYWLTDLATVQDGNLHIRTAYYPDGYLDNGKPGWYTCGLDTAGLYEQKYGYFEIRCILPKGSGMWAAFWMLCSGMSNVDGGGTDGAEIDVFEAPFYGERFNRKVASNLHIDGYGEAHQSKKVCEPYVLFNNPYESYNTYGVAWNKDGYTFYINGINTGRSDFGGASQVPEYLILSVEVGGNDGVPGESWAGDPLAEDSEVSDFIVDYVRAYQYK